MKNSISLWMVMLPMQPEQYSSEAIPHDVLVLTVSVRAGKIFLLLNFICVWRVATPAQVCATETYRDTGTSACLTGTLFATAVYHMQNTRHLIIHVTCRFLSSRCQLYPACDGAPNFYLTQPGPHDCSLIICPFLPSFVRGIDNSGQADDTIQKALYL